MQVTNLENRMLCKASWLAITNKINYKDCSQLAVIPKNESFAWHQWIGLTV